MLPNLREQGQTIETLLSQFRRMAMTVAMRVCAQAIARDSELINIAAAELAAAFRQGGEDGLRVALRKMTRRVLATIAANLGAVSKAEATPAAPPAEDEQRLE
jgi:hypothetical protein